MKTALAFIFLIPAVSVIAGVGKDTIALNEVVKVEQISNDAGNTSPFTDLKYKTGERLSDALVVLL